jgi:hypothetical protein
MRQRTLLRGLCGLLLLSALVCLSGSYGIREEEFECEEAAQNLRTCCPDLPGDLLTCIYEADCSRSRHPDLDPATARCLRKKRCDELQKSGVCDVKTWAPASPACDGPCRPLPRCAQ